MDILHLVTTLFEKYNKNLFGKKNFFSKEEAKTN
jgi:hypothetical protein